jgi:hypothetical protein
MADIKNYIDQIKIGETTYDIATKRSIKFTNGGVETLWNGLSDITVAIPSISDLVQSPIVFAGTVGKGGINWSEGYSEPALKGYLLFVTETCTIDSGDSDSDFATVTCEKGDMAIYDGSKWNIVSGENQVKIVRGSAGDIAEKISVEIGSAKDVLVVEGKALTLSLDYADINKHISKTEGDTETVDLTKVKVNEEYIKLSAADKPTTIGEEVELKNIKGIKDSTVSFTVTESEDGQLVKSVDFGTYTDGTLPTFKMNESAVDLDVEVDSLTVVSSDNGDFVSSVALDAVTFIEDGEGKTAVNSITVVDNISESEGDDFLKGMHITVKGENGVDDEVADLTIEYIVPEDGVGATFVTGLTDGTDVVTEVTGGEFTLVDGTDVVTGFGAEVNDNTGDVLTDVTVSASSESVLKEAKVENHVLSFDPIDVTSDVSLNYKSKSLTKKGVSHTPINVTKKGLATKGFKTDNIELTFDKGKETVYTPTFKTWKLNTPELTVNKASYEMGDIKASIPANSFVSEMKVGELPSWTGAEIKYASVAGSVKHEIEYDDNIVLNVLTDANINLPTYTIVSAESEEEGVTVKVGKAGALTGSGSVDLSQYIKDITIE